MQLKKAWFMPRFFNAVLCHNEMNKLNSHSQAAIKKASNEGEQIISLQTVRLHKKHICFHIMFLL